MIRLYLIILLTVLIVLSCTEKKKHGSNFSKVEFDPELADELKAMAKIDQVAAYIPQGKYKEWSKEKWDNFKDSVFRTHKKRMEEIFTEYGYPGYDLVGQDGSNHFWLMVQHSDFDPDFQLRVLEKLQIEVDNKNADGSTFGLLTDRVKLNKGEMQIYGTQVDYNDFGQAYPKSLADSINVNRRRADIGLESIEEYLNRMTQMHFVMNKEYLKGKGITEPMLYETNK